MVPGNFQVECFEESQFIQETWTRFNNDGHCRCVRKQSSNKQSAVVCWVLQELRRISADLTIDEGVVTTLTSEILDETFAEPCDFD